MGEAKGCAVDIVSLTAHGLEAPSVATLGREAVAWREGVRSLGISFRGKWAQPLLLPLLPFI